MTKNLIVTASIERELDPDHVESHIRGYYDVDAHTDLRVTDPETGEVVWEMEDA